MIALIDADIVLYRVGFTTNNDSVEIARARTDDVLDGILVNTGATEFQLWLSDKLENNFRFQLSPDYKANRIAEKPIHYDAIKEHMIVNWGARFAYGMEADDALGINQDQSGYNDFPHTGEFKTTICSIDKDLFQIPGLHYNFVKDEWNTVEPWDGLRWFYKQILIGDTVDNIKGCKGIGETKAGRICDCISSADGEGALFRAVLETYRSQEGSKAKKEKDRKKSDEEILSHILLAGRLLKIRQEEEELWNFPSSVPTVELKQSSTQPTPEAIIQSTEPIAPNPVYGFPLTGAQTGDSIPQEPHS
jgi:hypothetical protein